MAFDTNCSDHFRRPLAPAGLSSMGVQRSAGFKASGGMTTWLAGLACLTLLAPAEARAQKRIPKATGHDQFPLDDVNTLETTCVLPIR